VSHPDRLFRDDLAEIWHADSLNPEHVAEVMGERKADLLCVDAPYSDKTHAGHSQGKMTANRAEAFARRPLSNKLSRANAKNERAYAARKAAEGSGGRRDIDYPAWTPADVDRFVKLWSPLTNGWLVSITDDVLSQHWRAAYEAEDRVTFPSIPLIETGSRVRMHGDGPSNWSCFIMVARPKGADFKSWGTLTGWYAVPGERDQNSADGSDRIVGGKPKRAMIQIVQDYSLVEGLVVDSVCGAATTGIAALRTGRRFIGCDVDRKTAELAAEIIKAERSDSTRRRMVAGQTALFAPKETGS
jgi:hypothetical protein